MNKYIINIFKILLAFLAGYIIIGILTIFNDNISISTYDIKNEKIPSVFKGFKILQITDLHDAMYGKNQVNLIKKIDKINPDIIVFTGDMYDKSKKYKAADVLMKKVGEKYVSYYITGNHEAAFKDIGEHIEKIKSYGINVLGDGSKKIYRGNEYITIQGIDDLNLIPNYKIENQLDNLKINENYYNIMLYHRPKQADIISNYGYDLIMSGHMHGGQIRYFGVGFFSPDDKFFPDRTKGIYNVKKSKLIVSAGLCLKYRSRIYNPPELVVVKLNPNE